MFVQIMMKMKAAFYRGNKTIRVEEVSPVEVGPGQVQLKVSHCGICGTDLHIFQGHMDKRIKIPAVIGHEASGVVAYVGPGVEGFKPGDRLVVRPLEPCGQCPACEAGYSHICQNLKFIGIDSPGAFQQRWNVPAHTLHRLPDSVSMEHGAMIEPLAVACHDVRMGGVKQGDFVVVIGGGPIGMLIALVARQAGARVLVSEVNPYRLSLGKEFGLETADPRESDLPELVEHRTGGAGADVVFEVSGSSAGLEVMTKLPRTRGKIVVVAIVPEPQKVDLFRFFWRELQMVGARVYEPEDFEEAISLAGSATLPLGRLVSSVRPLVDLQKAFEDLQTSTNTMKVIIKCS